MAALPPPDDYDDWFPLVGALLAVALLLAFVQLTAGGQG